MTKEKKFDAIVVGARCAGSSTAMLLARRGYNVLILDRGQFPSDLKASTHLIWHGGVASLKRWGLLDKLRGIASPLKKVSLDLGGLVLKGRAPPAGDVDEAYAPRRNLLDHMLLQSAQDAGAEFRAGCTVQGVITEDERVCGVRFSDSNGLVFEERASIVIGADAINSVVARSVAAAPIHEHPRVQGMLWSYFSDLPVGDTEFYSRPARMLFAWYTSEGQTLAGICVRHDEYPEIAQNADTAMYAELDSLAPDFGERVRAAKRETQWMAGVTGGICRKASGPGWALVGDAGLTMDPITGWGITNSFRDAELLSDLVHEGFSGPDPLDDVVGRFEEVRNASSLPLYHFSHDMGKLEPPPQPMIDLFSSLPGNQDDINAYFGVFAQTVPVTDFFAPENVQRIISAGNTGVKS